MPRTSQPEPNCPHGYFSTIMFNDRPFCLECGRFLDIEDGEQVDQSDGVQEGQPAYGHQPLGRRRL